MKNFILLTFILLSIRVYSQSDLQVTLYENTLNKVFTTLGVISGTGEYELMFIKSNYTWTLNNMRIDLLTDSAQFITDATVVTGLGTYQDQVIGKVSISYDQYTNLISVKVVDAVFEVFIEMFGKKIVLKRVQIADYLTSPFQFEGPMSISNELAFTMPDGSVRKMLAKPSTCVLKVLPDRIDVSTQIQFVQK
jgi:hypothetical protein